MASAIKMKRSGTQGSVPDFADFVIGELCYNYYDGRLFARTFDGATDAIIAIGEQEQLDIPRVYFETVALAEVEVFKPGERCFILETLLTYWYDQNSSETRNGISVLNTGGSGRLLVMPIGRIGKYLVKSSNYTVLNTDHRNIDCNTSSGAFTLTLPASPLDGMFVEIKNIGNNGNDLTIARNGQTIDGLSENINLTDKNSITLQFTTSGWQIR